MKALAGLRMLELTHVVSGPYAGMILADLGAEMIKVEPPAKGEMSRTLLADNPALNIGGMGPYFLSFSRNKKSVTIDLKAEEGLSLFYDLVRVSDVVLNNYSVGVPQRLKIDHERLAEINPKIITCSITGFGETGPDNDQPSYDMVAQAVSGVMSITGQPEGAPTRPGIPTADMCASLMAVTGILAAVVARAGGGLGQHVDISMLDAQISALNYTATTHTLTGEVPSRLGNAHPNHVPYEAYPCADGYIILAVVTDAFWKNLVEIMDIPEIDTPENLGRAGRLKNRLQIDSALSRVFPTQKKAYWLEKLRQARIPCAPVNNLAEAFEEAQVLARDMLVEVEYPDGRRVRSPGNPIKMSGSGDETFLPAPALGQHNLEIFGDLLGKDASEIAALSAKGII